MQDQTSNLVKNVRPGISFILCVENPSIENMIFATIYDAGFSVDVDVITPRGKKREGKEIILSALTIALKVSQNIKTF